MPRYRDALPQLNGDIFLTDGGLETTLVFHEGMDLPLFAAFDLLKTEAGTAVLQQYFRTYVDLAAKHGVGFVLEAATWRANPNWAAQLGYDSTSLAAANRRSIDMLVDIRDSDASSSHIVLSGCVGPRGDGYSVGAQMTSSEAAQYHAVQIATFAETEADMVTAITMTYAEEAIGVATAATTSGMPVVLSFTVETDGRLPSGQSLKAAIEQVEDETDGAPAYYMINCAHPDHFSGVLEREPWTTRICGVRANASRASHAELDEATALDDGNPSEFGALYAALRQQLPNLNVLGGCCGSDHRHVDAAAAAVLQRTA